MLDRLPINTDEWFAIVRGDGRATPFHHPEWARLIADCYGFQVFVLALRDDATGSIVAGVPVIETHRPFGGRRWSSSRCGHRTYQRPWSANNNAAQAARRRSSRGHC